MKAGLQNKANEQRVQALRQALGRGEFCAVKIVSDFLDPQEEGTQGRGYVATIEFSSRNRTFWVNARKVLSDSKAAPWLWNLSFRDDGSLIKAFVLTLEERSAQDKGKPLVFRKPSIDWKAMFNVDIKPEEVDQVILENPEDTPFSFGCSAGPSPAILGVDLKISGRKDWFPTNKVTEFVSVFSWLDKLTWEIQASEVLRLNDSWRNHLVIPPAAAVSFGHV